MCFCVESLPDPLKVQSNLQELIAMLDESKFSNALSNAINTSLSCQEVLKAKVGCMNIIVILRNLHVCCGFPQIR